MAGDPRLAMGVGLVHDLRGLVRTTAVALHRASDQRRPGSIAENVKSIRALGQHCLRATTDDHQRAGGDRLIHDVARHLDELLVGGLAPRCRHRRDPFLRAQGQRIGYPLDQRRHPFLSRGYLSGCDAKPRSNLIQHGIVEE